MRNVILIHRETVVYDFLAKNIRKICKFQWNVLLLHSEITSRSGAVVARQAHNLEVVRSSRASATK